MKFKQNLTNNILIISLVLALLLVSGCTGGSQEKHEIYDVDIYKGTDGLVVEFAKDNPPSTVLEKQPFAVGLQMYNKGAYDINEGWVSLITEEDYVEVRKWGDLNPHTTKLSSFSLEGKTKFNPDGGQKLSIVEMHSNELPSLEETHTVFVGANFCYPYKSKLSDSVCIDPDIYNTRKIEKACEVDEITSSGQGAPVVISSITPKLLSMNANLLKPQFKVVFENRGQGKVIKPEMVQTACTSGALSRDDLNGIHISSALLSGEPLKCDPEYVLLRDGKGTSYCTLENGINKAASAYTSSISVEVEYGYTNNIGKQFEIRKVE